METTYNANYAINALFPDTEQTSVMFKTPQNGAEVLVNVYNRAKLSLTIDSNTKLDKHDVFQISQLLLKLSEKLAVP